MADDQLDDDPRDAERFDSVRFDDVEAALAEAPTESDSGVRCPPPT